MATGDPICTKCHAYMALCRCSVGQTQYYTPVPDALTLRDEIASKLYLMILEKSTTSENYDIPPQDTVRYVDNVWKGAEELSEEILEKSAAAAKLAYKMADVFRRARLTTFE